MHNAVLASGGTSLWLEAATGLVLAVLLLVLAELLARHVENSGGRGRSMLRDRSAPAVNSSFARE